MLELEAVIFQGLNVDPIGHGERVIFLEKLGKNIGFHEKSQGKFVVPSQKSGEFFQKAV